MRFRFERSSSWGRLAVACQFSGRRPEILHLVLVGGRSKERTRFFFLHSCSVQLKRQRSEQGGRKPATFGQATELLLSQLFLEHDFRLFLVGCRRRGHVECASIPHHHPRSNQVVVRMMRMLGPIGWMLGPVMTKHEETVLIKCVCSQRTNFYLHCSVAVAHTNHPKFSLLSIAVAHATSTLLRACG